MQSLPDALGRSGNHLRFFHPLRLRKRRNKFAALPPGCGEPPPCPSFERHASLRTNPNSRKTIVPNRIVPPELSQPEEEGPHPVSGSCTSHSIRVSASG